jgi:hypothetical protein
VLDNKCPIYEEDSRSRSAHYKIVNENNSKNQDRGKPYEVPTHKGKQKFQQGVAGEQETSGGNTPAPMRCLGCGSACHRTTECKSTGLKCFKCGAQCHRAAEC